jgi:predicted DNA-binding transcriptional regulator YafY
MKNSHDLILRQLAMLRIIPKHPNKITAGKIAAKLEVEGFVVTKRTIERDLQGLSSAFPLMSDERSKPFGWSWSADAPAIDLPGLSVNEALTLKLAEQYLTKLMPSHMVQQLTPYFKAASQVLNALESKSQLTSWPDKIAVVLPSQPLIPPSLNASVVEQVEQALLTEMQLQINYQKRGEPNPQTLTVHPLGLILRGQVNYLCVTIFNYQDIVLLPVHRILEAKQLELSANRPKGFNLQSYADSGALGFEQKGKAKVKLQFKKSAGLHLYETPLSIDQVITEENDFLIVEATVVLNKQFEWWLNGFGESVSQLEIESI